MRKQNRVLLLNNAAQREPKGAIPLWVGLFLFGDGFVELDGLLLEFVAVIYIIQPRKEIDKDDEGQPAREYEVFFYEVNHTIYIGYKVKGNR